MIQGVVIMFGGAAGMLITGTTQYDGTQFTERRREHGIIIDQFQLPVRGHDHIVMFQIAVGDAVGQQQQAKIGPGASQGGQTTMAFRLFATIEETLEMTGIILFIQTLSRNLIQRCDEVSVTIED